MAKLLLGRAAFFVMTAIDFKSLPYNPNCLKMEIPLVSSMPQVTDTSLCRWVDRIPNKTVICLTRKINITPILGHVFMQLSYVFIMALSF